MVALIVFVHIFDLKLNRKISVKNVYNFPFWPCFSSSNKMNGYGMGEPKRASKKKNQRKKYSSLLFRHCNFFATACSSLFLSSNKKHNLHNDIEVIIIIIIIIVIHENTLNMFIVLQKWNISSMNAHLDGMQKKMILYLYISINIIMIL